MSYWYPWSPEDFERDTLHLDFATEGAYRRLIDKYMVLGGPLPDDDRALCRLLGCSMEEWLAVSERVRTFFTARDEKLHHKRCDVELTAQAKRDVTRRKVGKAGAEGRWKHKKTKKKPRNAKGTEKPVPEAVPSARKTDAVSYAETMPKNATEQNRTERESSTTTESIAARADTDDPVLVVVKDFMAVRGELWPNNPNLPSVATTLRMQAQAYLEAGATPELCAEVFRRVAEQKRERGEGPPTNLYFCRLTLENELAAAKPKANGADSAGNGVQEGWRDPMRQRWQDRLDDWRERRAWIREYGPRPDEPGCEAPSDLLRPEDKQPREGTKP